MSRFVGHLTEQEHQAIQDEVRRRRTPETYSPGKWSVSPWNRSPEVLGAKPPDQYPSTVTIRDITLRTIEQTPNVAITYEQRRRIGEALVDIGVRSMQVAWLSTPRGVGGLPEEIKALKALASDVEIHALGATTNQIDAAADAGADVMQIYGPAIPEFHLITGAYGRLILRAYWRGEDWRKTINYPKNESEAIAEFQKQIAYVHSKGMRAGAFASMLHYATPDYLAHFAAGMREAGAVEIGLGDGASGLGPEGWAYAVRIIRENAPGLGISLHTHNAFGLVMACTLAGLHEGAQIAEVSVNGLCSAVGQADLAEVAAALEILYGVKTGIELQKLTNLRKLVEDITGIKMSPNKAITGDHAWTYTEESIREETQYAPVHKAAEPEIFGNKARYMLGNHSGLFSVLSKLDELDLQVDESAVPLILEKVRSEMLVRRRGLLDEEIHEIAQEFGAEPMTSGTR